MPREYFFAGGAQFCQLTRRHAEGGESIDASRETRSPLEILTVAVTGASHVLVPDYCF